MSKIDALIAQIKIEQLGQTGKKVLVVEGEDDVLALKAFLNKRKPSWEQQWVVVPATGKAKVLEVLHKEPNWLGVIDRDEWTDQKVHEASQQHANLFVLPRFCIESYLLVPDEIWQALPLKQRAKLQHGQADLDKAIQANMSVWVRHAALWRVINPLYQRMRNAGYRGDILDDPIHAPNQQDLTQILQSWLDGLDPAAIAGLVEIEEQKLQALPAHDVLTKHLYAKKFYPMVVHAALNQLLGQKPERERVQALLRTLPLPADLAPLWVKMGL